MQTAQLSSVLGTSSTTLTQQLLPPDDSSSIRYSSHYLRTQLPLQQCASSCYMCGTHLPYFSLRRTDVDQIEEDMRLVERGRMVSPPSSSQEEDGTHGPSSSSSATTDLSLSSPFALGPKSPPSVMMATHCFNCSRLLCARCCLIRAAPEDPILAIHNPHTSISNIIDEADVSAPTSLLSGVVLFEDEQRNPLTDPNPRAQQQQPHHQAPSDSSLSSFLGRLINRGGSTASRVVNSVSSKVAQARAGSLFGQGAYCRGVTVCTSCFLFDLGYILAYSGSITQVTHLFTSLKAAKEFHESLPAYCTSAISHIGTGRIVVMRAKKVQDREVLTEMLSEERRRLLAIGFDNSLKVAGARGKALRMFLEQKMSVTFRRLGQNPSSSSASSSSPSSAVSTKRGGGSKDSYKVPKKVGGGGSGGWDLVVEGDEEGEDGNRSLIDRSEGGVVGGNTGGGITDEVIRIVHLNSAGFSKERTSAGGGGGVGLTANNSGSSSALVDVIVTEELALLQEQLESLHTANSEMILRVQACVRGAIRDRLKEEDSDLARSYDLLPSPSTSSPVLAPSSATGPNNAPISRGSTSDFESLGTPGTSSINRFVQSTFASATLRDENGNVVPFEQEGDDILLSGSSLTPARRQQLLAERVGRSDRSVPPDAWVEEISHLSLRSASDYIEEQSISALTSMLATSHGALTLLPYYLTIAVVWYSTDGCFEHHWLQCCGLESSSCAGGGGTIDEGVIGRGVKYIHDTASKALFGACVSLTGDLLATVENPHNTLNPDRAAAELATCGAECVRYLRNLPAYVGVMTTKRAAPTALSNQPSTTTNSDAHSSFQQQQLQQRSSMVPGGGAAASSTTSDEGTAISIRWVPSALQAVKELVEGGEGVGDRGAVLDSTCRLIAGRGLGVEPNVLMNDIERFMSSVSEREEKEGLEECQDRPIRSEVIRRDALQQVVSTCSPSSMASRENLLRHMGLFVLKHRSMRALFVVVPGSAGVESSEVYPIQTFTDAQGLLRDYGAGVLVGLPEGSAQMTLLHRHPTTPRTLSLNLLNFSMRSPMVHVYLEAAKIKVPRVSSMVAFGSADAAMPTGASSSSSSALRRTGAGGADRRNHISDDSFDCNICFEPYNTKDRRPCICTNCGNTLCSACVGKITTCSYCRCAINSTKVVPNVLIMQMLSAAPPQSN